MQLSHSFLLPVAFDAAWDSFDDLEGLVPCVPGATLLSHDGDSFTGSVKVKLGPISMLYTGTGTFVERDKAAGRIVVEAKGKDKRGNGTAGATVVAQITPAGDHTAVEVTTDLAVTGKPAQFGRGVIQEVSDKLLGQFVDAFIAKLGPDAAAETAVEAAVTATAATGASDASVSPEPAPLPSPTPRPAPVPPPARQAVAGTEPAELDLLSTVLPVLVRRYAVPAVIALVVILAIRSWMKR